MQIAAETFGKILALLEASINTPLLSPQRLSNDEQPYFEKFSRRLKSLINADKEEIDLIFTALSNDECRQSSTRIDETETDIFLCLVAANLTSDTQNSRRLFKHLNSCFYFFEKHVEVMRAYLHHRRQNSVDVT